MCGMVIRIRNSRNATESRNRLIAMLEDVLSREDSDVKKRKLEEKYAMKMTLELEGRINRMCNLSDVVVERGIELGIQQGIQQGMQRGIKGLVDILSDMGTPKEVIVQKIMEKFSMTEEKAREFVEEVEAVIIQLLGGAILSDERVAYFIGMFFVTIFIYQYCSFNKIYIFFWIAVFADFYSGGK